MIFRSAQTLASVVRRALLSSSLSYHARHARHAGKHTLAKKGEATLATTPKRNAASLAAARAVIVEEETCKLVVSAKDSSRDQVKTTHIADLRSFLSRFGQANELSYDTSIPSFISSGHPLLTDDFAQLPPFCPPLHVKIQINLPISATARTLDEEKRFDHLDLSYLLTGRHSLLSGTSTALAEQLVDTLQPLSDEGMQMTSVLRKRRKKMYVLWKHSEHRYVVTDDVLLHRNKHKLKKRRKGTRSQRHK